LNLVIDASNIISGGGLTHLFELLNHVRPKQYGFKKVTVWGPSKTLEYLPEKEWLNKKSHIFLNWGYLFRLVWKHFILKNKIKENDLVFIPGTGYLSGKTKVITMCRNLLPLELSELNRYFFSLVWVRLLVLRVLHLRSFRKADGIIFLNSYCKSKTDKLIGGVENFKIIPHGINETFRFSRTTYEFQENFELLYVSTLDLYKHQWLIAEAVLELRKQGVSVSLTLIGDVYGNADEKLNEVLREYPKYSQCVKWVGKVNYEVLPRYYKNADAFIYGSTCETFGMTLLEAMASSLPIACSDKQPMKDMVQDAAVFFDPKDVKKIKKAILKLYNNEKVRAELGEKAYNLALDYEWEKTANETFKYLSKKAFN